MPINFRMGASGTADERRVASEYSMAEAFDPDVLRFLELLCFKIGINALARITILEHANPDLKLVRYYRADAELESDSASSPSRNRLSEIVVSAKLIDSVFQLALEHEDSVIPFMHGKLAFYDAVNYQHENRRTFVLVFMHLNML